MNLQDSILRLYMIGSELYVELSQCFNENHLIRDVWVAMAHDESAQLHSLNALPSFFWNRLKQEQDGIQEAIRSDPVFQAIDKPIDMSLKGCFQRALNFENSAILRVSAPIIRHLRKDWTDRALDFYIIVKAHVARINRATESFSGDPLLIQRSAMLLQSFENQVQVPEPQIERRRIRSKPGASQPARINKTKARTRKRVPLRARPLVNHAKSIPSRAKPLAETIDLGRRRARP